ncbi:MAG: hypothetical protein PHX51_01765 [Clostridia bacterium]|nr:hypothetical protein [Clostridia bacterium]
MIKSLNKEPNISVSDLAEKLFSENDIVSAFDVLSQAISNGPNADVEFTYGILLLRLSLLDEARIHFYKALIIDPEHKKSIIWLKNLKLIESTTQANFYGIDSIASYVESMSSNIEHLLYYFYMIKCNNTPFSALMSYFEAASNAETDDATVQKSEAVLNTQIEKDLYYNMTLLFDDDTAESEAEEHGSDFMINSDFCYLNPLKTTLKDRRGKKREEAEALLKEMLENETIGTHIIPIDYKGRLLGYVADCIEEMDDGKFNLAADSFYKILWIIGNPCVLAEYDEDIENALIDLDLELCLECPDWVERLTNAVTEHSGDFFLFTTRKLCFEVFRAENEADRSLRKEKLVEVIEGIEDYEDFMDCIEVVAAMELFEEAIGLIKYRLRVVNDCRKAIWRQLSMLYLYIGKLETALAYINLSIQVNRYSAVNYSVKSVILKEIRKKVHKRVQYKYKCSVFVGDLKTNYTEAKLFEKLASALKDSANIDLKEILQNDVEGKCESFIKDYLLCSHFLKVNIESLLCASFIFFRGERLPFEAHHKLKYMRIPNNERHYDDKIYKTACEVACAMSVRGFVDDEYLLERLCAANVELTNLLEKRKLLYNKPAHKDTARCILASMAVPDISNEALLRIFDTSYIRLRNLREELNNISD